MRIFISCAPEDWSKAVELGQLARLRLSREEHPIAVGSQKDVVEARAVIDESELIVFLLSPEALRLPWLVDLVKYANDAQERGAPKLIVKAELRPYPNDARLDDELRDAYPTSGNLQQIALQIVYYSSFRLVQSGGFTGWRPTRAPEIPPAEESPASEAPAAPPGWIRLGGDQPKPPAAPEPSAPPAGQAGEESGWDGNEQERGLDRDASAATPSAPQPAAPPPGVVGGLPGEAPGEAPGGAPIPAPAPSAESEQQDRQDRQDRQDQRQGAPRQRGEAAPSSGVDASALQFSAYHPNTVAVSAWQTLIVYTYLAEALGRIQADASTFTELGSAPTVAKGQASRQVEKGVELTLEPHMEGVTFSPERETFIWRGDWRRTLFRFSGAADLAGREQHGWIDIYAGPMVPVARIDLTVPFHDDHGRQLAVHQPRGMIVSSNIYDAVFISYSHHDGEAFRQACDEYNRFGVTVYTDEQLEAGAQYDQVLRQRIAEANVFHLLWSPHSAASAECHKEWMAALQREPSERFIKPWFWRKPLSAPPTEFVAHHISFKYEPLRRRFSRPSTWFA
jgi:hypothetical protein